MEATMTVLGTTRHAPKTLGESAVCFGCTLALLAVAAVVLQWALHLLP
jgi:hypothetical protein